MSRAVLLAGLAAVLCAAPVTARDAGFGVDAFNRVVPASSVSATVFSPLSFEIDGVLFAEAVDPIRRSVFSSALRVTDDFASEYGALSRQPFPTSGASGSRMAWAHAIVVEEPRRIDPSFRLAVQELYGVEVCRAKSTRGVEAWVRARFAGDHDGWRLPASHGPEFYSLQDLVSLSVEALPTNALRRICPTHAVYRQPLAGGLHLYALVPKAGRPLASVRTKLTSATLPELLAMSSVVTDPPAAVRVSLPGTDIVSTNELAGAFSYFRFPTVALKPFPAGLRPSALRQTVRFRLRVPPPAADAEPLEGPFLFFIHDPAANTLPAAGIIPGKGPQP